MNRTRWIIGIVVFVFISLGIYAFAYDGGNQPPTDLDPNQGSAETENTAENQEGATNPFEDQLEELGDLESPTPEGAGTALATTDDDLVEVPGEWELTSLGWREEGFDTILYSLEQDAGLVCVKKDVADLINDLVYPEVTFVINGVTSSNKIISDLTITRTPRAELDIQQDCFSLPFGSYTITELESENYSFVSYTEELDADPITEKEYTFIITSTNPIVELTALNIIKDPLLTIEKSRTTSTENGDGYKVRPGDTITYSLLVTNTGEGKAYNVVVTDVLPEGITLKSSSLPDNCEAVNKTVTCDIGFIESAASENENSVTIRFEVTVDIDTLVTLIKNQANVKYDNGINPDDEKTATSNEVENVVITPNVRGVKSSNVAELNPLYLNDELIYTISVYNTGTDYKNNVIVTDNVPAGTSLVTTSLPSNCSAINNNKTVKCTIVKLDKVINSEQYGTVAELIQNAPEVVNISFTVKINGAAIVGDKTLENKAIVDDTETNPVYNSVGTSIDLIIEKHNETQKPVDVILVIDRSYSMNDNNKWANAKTAAKQFVNKLMDGKHDVNIGIVYFGRTSLGSLSLSGSQTTVTNYINNSMGNPTNNDYTNIHAGLVTARALLNSSTRTGSDKYIVLLSDGIPTAYNNGTGTPPTCSTSTYTATCADPAISEASSIKSAGINLFTLGFDIESNTTLNTAARGLLQTVASKDINGKSMFYLSSNDVTELSIVFNAIVKVVHEYKVIKTDVGAKVVIEDVNVADEQEDGSAVITVVVGEDTYTIKNTCNEGVDTNGNPCDWDENWDDNQGLGLNYNKDEKEITWDLDEYSENKDKEIDADTDISIAIVTKPDEEEPEDNGEEGAGGNE